MLTHEAMDCHLDHAPSTEDLCERALFHQAVLIARLAAALGALLCGSAASALPPLSVSPDGRQLLAGNEPFFWLGDTAWEIYRLNPQELDVYFADRQAKGFNVMQGPALHTNSENYLGESNPIATQPNEQWFAYIDQIIDTAEAHGMYVVPVLTGGTSASQFTLESAYDYGYYIGERYRDATNIAAFIVSAEFNYPQDNVQLWDAIARGVIDGSAPRPRLLTCHPRWFGVDGGQTSAEALHHMPWMSFNMLQSSLMGNCTNDPEHLYYLGTHNWRLVADDWQRTPAKPVIDAEATYEQVNPSHPSCEYNPPRWSAFGVRRRAYWSVFAGAFGHTYGANGVFQFHKSDDPNPVWAPLDVWDVAVDYPGADDMSCLRRLMESRPLAGRTPRQSLLLSGATELVPRHIQATRGAQRSFAMIYVPQVNKRITIDMRLIAGARHRMWWFDPSACEATLIGEFRRSDYNADGGFTIRTPATGQDWVLVIDKASAGFGPPGGEAWDGGGGDGDGDGDDGGVAGAKSLVADDVIEIMLSWGPCAEPCPPCASDLDDDCDVDGDDLIAAIVNMGL
jgi:hypothetical protein